ncbi:MAG: hypothetical protein QM667_10260 [Asticcacaulis sp.]
MNETHQRLSEDALISDPAQKAQVVAYIRDMIDELAVLAERAQCRSLCDSLRQVHDEARTI